MRKCYRFILPICALVWICDRLEANCLKSIRFSHELLLAARSVDSVVNEFVQALKQAGLGVAVVVASQVAFVLDADHAELGIWNSRIELLVEGKLAFHHEVYVLDGLVLPKEHVARIPFPTFGGFC